MNPTSRCGAWTAAFLLTAAAAAAPAGASRIGCDAAAHGHRVIAESARGLVFERGARLVGCSYSGGRLSVLPGQGRFKMEANGRPRRGKGVIDPRRLRISGRFVAYGAHWTAKTKHPSPHFGPPTTERVISFDLLAGRTRYASTPNNDFDVRLHDLVVKTDGAVAWIYSTGDIPGLSVGRKLVVKMDRATGGKERGLDSDSDSPGPDQNYRYKIRVGSLALSANGRRIYWTATHPGWSTPHHLSARLV